MAQSTRSRAPQGGEIIEASRRGAHRARPSAVLAVLPAVAVIAILAALGVLVYTMLLKPLTAPSSGRTLETTGSSASAAAAAGGTAKASPGASAGASEGASAGTSSGGASAPAGAAATPDPSVIANFYNATTTKGLSRKAAAQAEAAGWRIGAIQTWAGPAVTGTTVYVASSSLQASGEAMAKALGVGVVKVSATNAGRGRMSVVVGTDYVSG